MVSTIIPRITPGDSVREVGESPESTRTVAEDGWLARKAEYAERTAGLYGPGRS